MISIIAGILAMWALVCATLAFAVWATGRHRTRVVQEARR